MTFRASTFVFQAGQVEFFQENDTLAVQKVSRSTLK